VRNIRLTDAVITLHEIARTVAEELGTGQLHDDIRSCADRLHECSRTDEKISKLTQNIIDNKATE
jgi:hypothetical protein